MRLAVYDQHEEEDGLALEVVSEWQRAAGAATGIADLCHKFVFANEPHSSLNHENIRRANIQQYYASALLNHSRIRPAGCPIHDATFVRASTACHRVDTT